MVSLAGLGVIVLTCILKGAYPSCGGVTSMREVAVGLPVGSLTLHSAQGHMTLGALIDSVPGSFTLTAARELTRQVAGTMVVVREAGTEYLAVAMTGEMAGVPVKVKAGQARVKEDLAIALISLELSLDLDRALLTTEVVLQELVPTQLLCGIRVFRQ